MIPVQRPDKPDGFDERAQPFVNEVLRAIEDEENVTSELTGKHSKVQKDAKIQLLEVAHGKCMYCETKVSDGPAELEHILPKSRYPRLAYEWSNWGVACKWCNTRKSSHIFNEETPVLNPYEDDIEENLSFSPMGPVGKTELGVWVVDQILNNNRAPMLSERNDHVNSCSELLDVAEGLPAENRAPLVELVRRRSVESGRFSRYVRSLLELRGY